MAKKISAIVSLALVGILLIATIIMANVKVDYSINCATPTDVWVRHSSISTETNAEEEKTEIVKLINEASKEMSLSALFTGKLFNKAEIVTDSSTGQTVPKIEGYYVTYSYATPQVLKYGNKDYVTAENGKYYYKELVYAVTSAEGVKTVNVYVKPYYEADGTTLNTSDKYTKYYKLEANFEALYDYLADNFSK